MECSLVLRIVGVIVVIVAVEMAAMAALDICW